MAGISALSKERKVEIARAFAAWYDALSKKGEGMRRIGQAATSAHFYRRGEKYPPPSSLRVLWQETRNPAFLFTLGEKGLYRRLNRQELPDTSAWPDRVAVEQKVDVAINVQGLAGEITRIHEMVQALASLPARDPVREEARAVLSRPAMRLFRALAELDLEFPDAFRDLLRQLDVATQIGQGRKGK